MKVASFRPLGPTWLGGFLEAPLREQARSHMTDVYECSNGLLSERSAPDLECGGAALGCNAKRRALYPISNSSPRFKGVTSSRVKCSSSRRLLARECLMSPERGAW